VTGYVERRGRRGTVGVGRIIQRECRSGHHIVSVNLHDARIGAVIQKIAAGFCKTGQVDSGGIEKGLFKTSVSVAVGSNLISEPFAANIELLEYPIWHETQLFPEAKLLLLIPFA